MGLRETLEAATPGPWEARVWGHDTDEWPDSRVSVGTTRGHGEAVVINPRYGERAQDLANARLIALAPELAALCLEMGDLLRLPVDEIQEGDAEDVLIRLDQLGKEPGDE
jgi:hypothetical protein